MIVSSDILKNQGWDQKENEVIPKNTNTPENCLFANVSFWKSFGEYEANIYIFQVSENKFDIYSGIFHRCTDSIATKVKEDVTILELEGEVLKECKSLTNGLIEDRSADWQSAMDNAQAGFEWCKRHTESTERLILSVEMLTSEGFQVWWSLSKSKYDKDYVMFIDEIVRNSQA